MRLLVLSFAILTTVLRPALARAYDEESRFTVASTNAVQTVGAAGGEDTAPVFGASVRYAFGLSHTLEVGGSMGVGMGPLLGIEGATDGTSVGVLETTPLLFSAAADLRLSAGVAQSRAFVRTHPLIGVRLGLAGQLLLEQRFKVHTAGGDVMKPYASSDFSLLPFAGLDLGVEHRFGKGFVVGLIAGVTYGGSNYTAGQASLEVSWHWY